MYKYEVPARLHITLCDMNGNLGRINGGLGFSINEPKLIFYVEKWKMIQICTYTLKNKRNYAKIEYIVKAKKKRSKFFKN